MPAAAVQYFAVMSEIPLLLAGLFVPLALTILAPVIVNLVHPFMAPQRLPIAVRWRSSLLAAHKFRCGARWNLAADW
jgi:hypothetical protein